MISFYDWWHNLMFFCSFCLNCLSTCVIFNRYVPVGLANSCYNKDATPFSVLVLFNTGKARKGSSNYESNDIADDDPENAKGEFCRSHFPPRTMERISNEDFGRYWNPIWIKRIILVDTDHISIQIPTTKQKILWVFHRFPRTFSSDPYHFHLTSCYCSNYLIITITITNNYTIHTLIMMGGRW